MHTEINILRPAAKIAKLLLTENKKEIRYTGGLGCKHQEEVSTNIGDLL